MSDNLKRDAEARHQARLTARVLDRRRARASPLATPRPEPPLVAIRVPEAPLVLVDGRSVVTQRLRATVHHVGGEPREGASGDSDDWVGGVLVRLHIEVPSDHAKPRCLSLEVSAYNGDPVTTNSLRFPVDRLVHRAVAAATLRLEPGADEDRWHELTTTELSHGARAQLTARYGERRPRRGTPVPDERIEEAAAEYRKAKADGKPPTKAVADKMGVDPSTAKRYMKRAEAKGIFDPSERLDQAEGARSRASGN